MKKYCLLVLAVLLSLGLMVGNAHAVTTNPFPPRSENNTPYVTLQYDEVAKSVFGWDEQPFSFLWLPTLNSALTLDITNTWKYEGSVVATENLSYSGTSYKDWVGLSNWFDAGVRKPGNWSVTVDWGYHGSKYQACCNETPFTITPEPIGAILFGLGVGVFGFLGLRNAKK